MLSRAIYRKQRGRRWLTALSALSLMAGMFFFASTAAGLSQSSFELDKNVNGNETTEHLGTLKSKANAGVTQFTVCERQYNHDGDNATPPLVVPMPTAPFTILIDGETMTVLSRATGTVSAGGCSFGDPADSAAAARVWTLTAATTAAHAGGADVTGVTTSAADTVEDWSDIFTSVDGDDGTVDGQIADPLAKHTCDELGAVACSWAHDDFGETVYTTGGSKDDLNVNPNTPAGVTGESGTGWKWTNSSVPPSDEILDAFAVKYQVGSRQLLFFGADRWSTNGAKDMGFWFFKDEISLNTDGTFSGTHTRRDTKGTASTADDVPGDILLLSTFTQGGAVTNIRVFEWVGVGGNTNGTLQSIGSFGDCAASAGNANGCNTVNNTTVKTPWPYQGAGSTQVAGSIYAGGLAEGGIDLTALKLDGCFSSFVAETRSSPEAGAQLKDFVLGSFESCTTDLTTTPANSGGTLLTDGNDADTLREAQLGTGNAGVTVRDSAILDVKGSTSFTGRIDFWLCGPLDAPATCAAPAAGDPNPNGAFIGSVTANSNNTYLSPTANLTEVGRYCWRATFVVLSGGVPGDTDSSLGECFEVLPVTPTLSTQAIQPPLSAPVSGPVDFGQAVYDKAILGGTAYQPGDNGDDLTGGDADYPSINATNGAPAGGSITFTLYGPDDCTTIASGTGVNPQDDNDAAVVNGDGDYFSAGFTPDKPGDYHWVASYTSSDANTNNASHNGDCSDPDEDVTVRRIPTEIKTKQSWYPNDTATITSSVSGDLLEAGGSVVFELWSSDSCDGTKLYTETVTLTGGANSESVGTTNDGSAAGDYLITTEYGDSADSTAGPLSWKVTYTPATGDTAHTGIQSACDAENFSITYTNSNGPGTDLP